MCRFRRLLFNSDKRREHFHAFQPVCGIPSRVEMPACCEFGMSKREGKNAVDARAQWANVEIRGSLKVALAPWMLSGSGV
jgi:hypothetical protein